MTKLKLSTLVSLRKRAQDDGAAIEHKIRQHVTKFIKSNGASLRSIGAELDLSSSFISRVMQGDKNVKAPMKLIRWVLKREKLEGIPK